MIEVLRNMALFMYHKWDKSNWIIKVSIGVLSLAIVSALVFFGMEFPGLNYFKEA